MQVKDHGGAAFASYSPASLRQDIEDVSSLGLLERALTGTCLCSCGWRRRSGLERLIDSKRRIAGEDD